MFQVQPVTDLNLPALEPYRTMRRPASHIQKRILVAEGEKVVRRLLSSNFTVLSLLLAERRLSSFEVELKKRPEMIAVFVADETVLEGLVGYRFFRGVLAVARIPKGPSLEEMVTAPRHPCCFVALDGVTNPENLGVLVRNAAAFSADALLIGESGASPYLRRAVRNSMGAIFTIPVVEVPDLVNALQYLREHGIRCLAAHPGSHSLPLTKADFSSDCCLVFGHEGYGLSEKVLLACDQALSIPISQQVDSLNVASAAAIFLYQGSLQRRLNS